jgi:hypothetical protein
VAALEKARAALDTDTVESIPNRSALSW